MESVEDMVSRLDSMASGEPSWDLSDNDMSALQHALQFVPGSDYYKPPAAENQGGPDSASTNTGMLSASQIAAFKEAFSALADAREKLLESDNKFAAVWRQLQHT